MVYSQICGNYVISQFDKLAGNGLPVLERNLRQNSDFSQGVWGSSKNGNCTSIRKACVSLYRIKS